MPVIFVAKSAGQQDWANSVGLTKHVYKLGLTDDSAEDAVERLNAERHAGFDEQPAQPRLPQLGTPAQLRHLRLGRLL